MALNESSSFFSDENESPGGQTAKQFKKMRLDGSDNALHKYSPLSMSTPKAKYLGRGVTVTKKEIGKSGVLKQINKKMDKEKMKLTLKKAAGASTTWSMSKKTKAALSRETRFFPKRPKNPTSLKPAAIPFQDGVGGDTFGGSSHLFRRAIFKASEECSEPPLKKWNKDHFGSDLGAMPSFGGLNVPLYNKSVQKMDKFKRVLEQHFAKGSPTASQVPNAFTLEQGTTATWANRLKGMDSDLQQKLKNSDEKELSPVKSKEKGDNPEIKTVAEAEEELISYKMIGKTKEAESAEVSELSEGTKDHDMGQFNNNNSEQVQNERTVDKIEKHPLVVAKEDGLAVARSDPVEHVIETPARGARRAGAGGRGRGGGRGRRGRGRGRRGRGGRAAGFVLCNACGQANLDGNAHRPLHMQAPANSKQRKAIRKRLAHVKMVQVLENDTELANMKMEQDRNRTLLINQIKIMRLRERYGGGLVDEAQNIINGGDGHAQAEHEAGNELEETLISDISTISSGSSSSGQSPYVSGESASASGETSNSTQLSSSSTDGSDGDEQDVILAEALAEPF